MKHEIEKIYPESKQFTKDMLKSDLPFDLLSALTSVVKEVVAKDFRYIKMTKEGQDLITFEKPGERIIIGVTLESLLIRQFDIDESGNRKLKVLYIAKPEHRTFKLL